MSTATDMRDLYIAAEKSVLDGQTVTLPGGASVTMSNLTEIKAGRKEWQRKVDEETRAATGSVGPRYAMSDFS